MSDYKNFGSYGNNDYSGFGSESYSGGGGFNNNTTYGESSPQQQKKKETQSMRPTTIKMMLDSNKNDGSFIYDNKKLAQVTFVGKIMNIDVKQADVTYRLLDSSGEISCRYYLDSENNQSHEAASYKQNSYVRVFGTLSIYQGMKVVIVFKIIPINDFNEITYHYLDVIYTHLKLTRPDVNQQHNNNNMMMMNNNSNANTSIAGYASGYNTSGIDATMTMNNEGFSSIEMDVVKVFDADAHSENGTSIRVVMNRLPQYTPKQIKETIDNLCNNGHLYSTVDEEHFKSTSAV